ncbi:hypothetical protein N431DRAFT_561474 [Stipitochalara longipes BDJ]|nr:hypothetical protein N431DRAFT_561474 [Stipitochalara longipes BDJ]
MVEAQGRLFEVRFNRDPIGRISFPSPNLYALNHSHEKIQDSKLQKQMATSTSPRRFYLLTYPRTASNLLTKILALEDQPHILSNERGGYFFVPTVGLRLHDPKTAGRHLDEWTPEERTKLWNSYQVSFDALQKHLEAAEVQGKNVFVKEHVNWMIEPVAETKLVYGEESTKEVPWTVKVPSGLEQTHSPLNKTILPDDFLKHWLPTFLIRHPALVFPSNYRTQVDNNGKESVKNESKMLALEMTMHWTRTLYEWYRQQFAATKDMSSDEIWPIIIDADDIMFGPEVVLKYAKIIGLDSKKLKFSWTPKSKEELDKMWDVERRMLSTISASAGIVEGKTSKGLDVDEETKKWKVEFGEVEGTRIEKWVRDAMPDYEYLKSRRLRM